MTANAMQGDRERCLEAGMDDFLSKPVAKEALEAMLTRWLPPMPVESPGGAAPCGRPDAVGADLCVRPDTEGTHAGVPLQNHASDPPSPALDPAVLAELRELGGEDERGFMGELFTHLLQDTPPRLVALQQAAATGDAHALAKTAHSLKGSAGNVGARRMAALCETLEAQGRAGSVQGAEPIVNHLADEFERVRCAIDFEWKVTP
jgi:HPt (histidine-containing phosphotransfer) domain-containing protein